MPELKVEEPLTDAQEQKVHEPADLWANQFAGKVAVRDFERAAEYRAQNHDNRWKIADELYMAYVQQKTWPGTRIPRSSLGVFLTFQQIESFLPRAMGALFGNDPWFESTARHGTPAAAALASQDIMVEQLDQCRFRSQARLGVKSALLRGNGVLGLEWLHAERTVSRFIPEFVPKSQRIRGLDGRTVQAPTGQFERRVRERKITETENRPIVSYIPLTEFYIDPNCPTPNPQDARFVARRRLTSVDEIRSWDGIAGFDVPDKDFLLALAEQKVSEEGDRTKAYTETSRGGNWDPIADTTLDPGGKRIAVIHYWAHGRHVRVLHAGQRSWTIYNQTSPLIPFYDIFYADMLDRFYGLAITDVLEGEQRFQQAALNARVDELALSIHTPTAAMRGGDLNAQQLRPRPGAVYKVADPKNHVIRLFPQGATNDSHVETAASDIRAQRVTGLNDTVAAGVGGSPNPTGRSATGAAGQIQAGLARIQYFVENVETDVFETLLTDMHRMNNMFLDPNQMIATADGREVDPIQVFGADVRFRMRASSRMASRMALLQVFPTVFQALMAPALVEQLATQGKTVDFEALLTMLLETTQYQGRVDLIRELTPQEIQAMQAQQQQPSPEEMKLIMQRERMTDLREVESLKNEGKAELQSQKWEQDTLRELLTKLADKYFGDDDPETVQ